MLENFNIEIPSKLTKKNLHKKFFYDRIVKIIILKEEINA